MSNLEQQQIPNLNQHGMADDEINLRELFSAIWRGKWLIVCVTAIFAVASAFYALSLPDVYKSEALLAPAVDSSGMNVPGQLGGLASLAGINLGNSGGSNKVSIAMEIIKSWGFLEKFIQDNSLQVEVYAVRSWDPPTNKLHIDDEVYDEKAKKWLNKDGSINDGPSSWQLYKNINNRININLDKTTGLVKLSVEYYSPYVAKKWVDKLILAINDHIKKQDRKDLLKSIQYLKEKIDETNISQMQSVFYQLIEEQTKALMLAEVSDEYVLKTLSPAKVVEEKSKPRRAVMVILATILGAMLSIVCVLIRFYWFKE